MPVPLAVAPTVSVRRMMVAITEILHTLQTQSHFATDSSRLAICRTSRRSLSAREIIWDSEVTFPNAILICASLI